MSRGMKELVQQIREELPRCSFDDGKTWELDGVVIAERLEAAASALESQEEEIALLVDERDALKAENERLKGERQEPANAGDTYQIEHDGFEGEVIGRYRSQEGKEGVVLQQIGTRVVHVYGRKWLKK